MYKLSTFKIYPHVMPIKNIFFYALLNEYNSALKTYSILAIRLETVKRIRVSLFY